MSRRILWDAYTGRRCNSSAGRQVASRSSLATTWADFTEFTKGGAMRVARLRNACANGSRWTLRSCVAVRHLLVAVALASSSGPVVAQDALVPDLAGIPSEKVDAIRLHLQASGVARVMDASFKATLQSQREMAPDVPEAFWDEFAKRIVSDIDRFVEALIPAYDAHFTLEEIEGLTVFYRSPLGQRLVEVAGPLAVESSKLGEQWGAIVGAEVMLDLVNRGVIFGN